MTLLYANIVTESWFPCKLWHVGRMGFDSILYCTSKGAGNFRSAERYWKCNTFDCSICKKEKVEKRAIGYSTLSFHLKCNMPIGWRNIQVYRFYFIGGFAYKNRPLRT